MTSRSPTAFIRDSLILFLGVLSATYLVDSIQAETTTTLVLVALVLALLNSVLKPLLVIFALPFVLFSLGLGLIIINAVLLYLAGALVPGFTVPGFGAAILGALIISFINLIVNVLLAPKRNVKVQWNFNPQSENRRKPRGDDVIDV